MAVAGSAHRLLLSLIIVQMLIATFVAITMMGWWFPGRTLLTVPPLFAIPVVLLLLRTPLWGRITLAMLGGLTLEITYEHLRQRVWGDKSNSDVRAMRTIVSSLRRKLGDDADNPTYIFTEPRVGYRMPKGETKGEA